MKLSIHGTPTDFYIFNDYKVGKFNRGVASKWIKGNANLFYAIRNSKGKKKQKLMLDTWEKHKRI